MDTTPEMVFAGTVDARLPEYHLVPQLALGVQMPASAGNVVPNAGLLAADILEGRRTAVYRRAGRVRRHRPAHRLLPAGG